MGKRKDNMDLWHDYTDSFAQFLDHHMDLNIRKT